MSDIRLETESDFNSPDDIPARLDTRYQPRHALHIAVKDWFSETACYRMPPAITTPNSSPVIVPTVPSLATLDSVAAMGNPAEVRAREMEAIEEADNPSFTQPTMNPIQNSLVSSAPIPIPISNSVSVCSSSPESLNSTVSVEPMDVVPFVDYLEPPTTTSVPKNLSSDNLMQVEICDNVNNCDNNVNDNQKLCKPLVDNAVPSTSICDNVCIQCLEEDDLALLVDLFYLPFEHGSRGEHMLQQLHWLKCNAYKISREKINNNDSEVCAFVLFI